MGCGCRGSSRSSRSKTVLAPVRSRKQKSVCSKLESKGNDVTVSIGSSGHLFMTPPFGNGSGMPASSLLPSLGCNGSFAKAIAGAESKTMGLFANPVNLKKFRELIPHSNVKLGYLRSVLRHF